MVGEEIEGRKGRESEVVMESGKELSRPEFRFWWWVLCLESGRTERLGNRVGRCVGGRFED